ncbi:MAG: FAD-binding and (Fe-S)-binding domain-containing protein [Phycisphaerales bacterium]
MHLPVLNSAATTDSEGFDTRRAEIARELAARVRGRVRFGRHDRMLYATDASMYQIEPIGVVEPADEADAQAAVRACHKLGVAMLPRGGGTSLAGQCTSEAVVVDLSAGLRGIGPVEERSGQHSIVVQAGVSIDDLNAELTRRKSGGAGLFFAPDPATTAQSVIGGNVGNNAAGSRSVLYGRTSENLLGVDVLLADGRRVWLERGAGERDETARELARGVIEITRRHEALIREKYPKTLRQNAGYGLDRVLKQLDAGADERTIDLAQLVCGSEGTLAVTLNARLLLRPLPKAKGLALLAFASLEAAIDAVVPILATGPSAVELVDDVVIEAARGNIECSKYVDAFPRMPGSDRDPVAVLYVEYHCGSEEELGAKFAALSSVTTRMGAATRLVTDAPGMADAWKLRKAGEPLLHGMPGARHPLTFVEDNAVPPENLGRFVREFRKIVEAAGTRAAFWAHASVGVLHVRPMLNPHDPSDMVLLRRLAVEAADLAKACGGVMSGEHGDGRLRGPLLRRFFGDELIAAFGEIKRVFDPLGLLNPGNIVAPGPIESITERTRIEPVVWGVGDGHGHEGERPGGRAVHIPHVDTFFDYSDQSGFDGAVEKCNGAGVCRKSAGGTMCPSYRATMDERHATRGRGNALRLAISGQFGGSETARHGPKWDDAGTMETLGLCLSCKACKSECPSNVDIARLKAEYTAQRHKSLGKVPLEAWLTGHVRLLNQLGSLMPRLANWFSSTKLARAVINRVMHMHPERSMPKFSRPAGRGWSSATVVSDQRVVLFGDCFTTYSEGHIGEAIRRVVTKLGYDTQFANAGCCGRSMISVGMLPQAIETIDATIGRLRPLIDDDRVLAILVAEPSCLSAMKDDWLQLKCRTPLELRKKLAAKAMLPEEFIEKFWDKHPIAPKVDAAAVPPEVILHAHCHQKSLWGTQSSAKVLKRILGDRLKTPDTGCCGMAGSFGFDADKYELSMRIGNLPNGGILPIARGAGEGAVICATGTSCRHQIHDGAQKRAVHPIELLDRVLASNH